MKLKKILLVFLLGSAVTRLCGQSNDYQFSRLDFTNGLSNNHITSLYKDARGFMWFGTMAGLNRYDGYEFKVFLHDQKDPHSIGDNYIEQIFEGPEGKMWVQSRSSRFNIYDLATDQFDRDYGSYLRKRSLPEFWLLGITPGAKGYWFIYRDSGLFHYGPNGKITHTPQDSARPGSLSTALISDAREDHDGNCWVLHQNGLLEKIDGIRHTVVFRTTELEKVFGSRLFPCGLYIDNQNDIWLSASGYFKGVWCYHPATGAFTHFSTTTGPGKLSSDVIFSAIQDEKGRIWLATDHGGVDILDKNDGVRNDPDPRRRRPQKPVGKQYPRHDPRQHRHRLAGYLQKHGVSYYHQNGIQFPLFRHQTHDPHSLSFDDVNKFAGEDTRRQRLDRFQWRRFDLF